MICSYHDKEAVSLARAVHFLCFLWDSLHKIWDNAPTFDIFHLIENSAVPWQSQTGGLQKKRFFGVKNIFLLI